MPDNKINVFIAFSPADTALKDELEEHLTILQRQGVINVWHNQKIEAGENFDQIQAQALQNAQIILLLISSDFLASDYAYENEVLKALERHKQGQARVIPVILRDCIWKTGALGQLTPLPQGAIPVTEWDNPDSAFKNIATEIQKVVARFTLQNGDWVFAPNADASNTGKPKINRWLAAVMGIVAIATGIFAGIAYQNKATEAKLEEDKKQLIYNIQGDWVNPNTDDSFIHRLQFRENYVGVYSLGNNEEIYWGEQEVQVVTARKCKINYEDGLSFDVEVVKSNLFDTLVESLVAIYRIDTPGIMGLRNSRLVREKTLQLLAMRNPNKSTSRTDTTTFVLETLKVVNLKDLNLTPRMILDVAAIPADTAHTRINTTVVNKAIERRELNRLPSDTVKLNTAPTGNSGKQINHLKDANIRALPEAKPDSAVLNRVKTKNTIRQIK
ncbi:toll/interleukin-1 receptor domain-containing protein [Sphingobacteriales bacterium UPWRP_1]|nr:hypothetical protein BVG80_10900 [Sphingobacteriales bacterium TSM_CSM]PSJ77427.1 toll/interleukin-1 receptor domain-containing protein [Sphingobacteriales bacterium UPWRP_1]